MHLFHRRGHLRQSLRTSQPLHCKACEGFAEVDLYDEKRIVLDPGILGHYNVYTPSS